MEQKYKTNPNDPVNNPLSGENSLTKRELFVLELTKSFLSGMKSPQTYSTSDIKNFSGRMILVADYLLEKLNEPKK